MAMPTANKAQPTPDPTRAPALDTTTKSDARAIQTTKPPTHSKTREWAEALFIAVIAAFILRSFIVEAYRIPTGSMENTLLVGDFLLVNKFIYGAAIPFTDVRVSGMKDVEQGDIVVFKFPPDKEINYIKRCVATAGSTIEIRDKVILVDGAPYPLPLNARVNADTVASGRAEMNIFPKYTSFNKDNYGPLYVPKKGDVLKLSAENFYTYKAIIEYDGHTTALMGNQVYIDSKPASDYTVTQNYYFMMGDNRDNSLDSRYWGFVPESNIVGSALMIYWSWDTEIPLSQITEKLGSVRWGRIGTIIR